MSVLRRDENPPVGFSYELDMGVDGLFKVDVFRAHEPLTAGGGGSRCCSRPTASAAPTSTSTA